MALSEETKSRIRSLTTREMEEELILGRRSHFQREKFSYLQSVYKDRVSEDSSKIPHPTSNPPPQPTDTPHDPRFRISPLRIAEGVIIGILVVMVIWILNHYCHLNLALP
jgi:hypothetical protein